MDIVAIIISFLFLITGVIGSVLPVLPGLPFSYIGFMILYFMDKDISLFSLISWGIIVLLISIADYFIPPLLAKKVGGSRYAAIGSVVAIIVALFILPIGLLPAAFLGAFLGEFIYDPTNLNRAVKVGFTSFIGFICGTSLKVIIALALLIVSIISLF